MTFALQFVGAAESSRSVAPLGGADAVHSRHVITELSCTTSSVEASAVWIRPADRAIARLESSR